MNSEDRISQLPDELVCHILSFLPTIHSFRTTVLSRRWKNLQTSVNTIDMDYSARDFRCSTLFPKVVDAVLSVHDLSIIQRIRLSTSWSRISYDLPTSCCFSSLKILFLFSFDLKARYIEKLVTDCCPVLEELDIWGVVGDVVSNFRISAPKLKRLTMSFDTIPTLSHVVINAPELEILYVEGGHITCTLESPRFLDKAVIIDRYLSHKYANDSGCGGTILTILLAGVSGIEELSIEVGCFETCNFPTAPALNALNKLELILNNIFSGGYVTKFLNRSPNIEYLALELKNKYLREEQSFIPPEFVPVCLSSHLKAISMRGITGRSSELELLRYLLQYGDVLNELTISCHPTLNCGKEESLYKEVLSFPRASRTCQVKFIEASGSASS